MKKHHIILLLVLPILNSCFCYESYLNEVSDSGLYRYSNVDWRQLYLDVEYRDIEKNELMNHTKKWLESNFYYKDKLVNATDENLIKSNKIFELYDEENFRIQIKGIRKDNIDRIFECRVLVEITDEKVSVHYYDFTMFEKYSRESYTLKNECTFIRIKSELIDLTNKFLYTKFN